MRGVGRRCWSTAATVALLVHALAITGRLAWKESRRIGHTEHDTPEHAARLARFRALAAALPEGGVIGFVGDPRPTTGAAHFDALQHPQLQQVQFELAPRVLVDGTAPAHVVVSRGDAATAYATAAAHGLLVTHDLGGGTLVATRAPWTPGAPGAPTAGAAGPR